MSALGKIATGVVLVGFIAVLVLGYLGFAPVISDVLGANTPRSLGVSATAVTGSQINEELGVTFTTLPPSNEGKASLEERGSQPVDIQLTSEELTALINDHASKWKYYPIEKVQIRINADDTIELSGVLRVDRWRGFGDAIGIPEQNRELIRPYLGYVDTNPAIFVKGTLELQDITQISVSEIQIGKINIPIDIADRYAADVGVFVSYVAHLYNVNLNQIYVKDSTIFVTGTIPTEVALSPPVEQSLQQVGFWAPPRENALIAFGSVTFVFILANLMQSQLNLLGEYLSNLLPKSVRVWFDYYIRSKVSITLEERGTSAFILTKLELFAYAIALSILTLAYAYSGAATLQDMMYAIPIVITTSVLVEFVKNYFLNVFTRTRGTWVEYRLWPQGLFIFVLSSFIFKTPFSSPSKQAKTQGERNDLISGLIAVNSVLISTALAGGFYYLKMVGVSDIGRIGVSICLFSALFNSIPIKPLNGKTIWNWNKVISIVLLTLTFFINFYWVTYV